MPELPEVEVTRRSLAHRIDGARILDVYCGKPLRWPLGAAPQALVGSTVQSVRRRGKYLLFDLDRGMLLIHLGMSGSLVLAPSLPPRSAHDHFELVTDRGVLRLNDPRRFGAVVFAPHEQSVRAERLLGGLGVEPFSEQFDLPTFRAALKLRRAAIKQVLLAGDLVVGVGNIYACEALFLAGIRPTRSAARVGAERAARLHAAIRDVLGRAVAAGGSTLKDFTDAHGQSGHFQQQTQVYGRADQPCKQCGVPIRLLRQAQRSTYFCPVCQKY